MKIELLGTFGGNTDENKLTSFLIDDFLAVDAGALTQSLSLERQSKITDIVISHAHLDHTLSLPFLADNMFGEIDGPIRVHASAYVIKALRDHVFNEVTWPDFTILPNSDNPTMTLRELQAEETVAIRHLRITPIKVNHVVPCYGYIIESTLSGKCLLYTADTANTDRIWELANRRKNLQAVIVDCSFPNNFEELAVASGHMTPQMLARDLAKLKIDCRILVYHIKPMYSDRLKSELQALDHPRLEADIADTVLHL